MDFLERITTHFSKQLPFVAYRKPNEVTVKAIFQNDDQLHSLETYTETGFVFAPFAEEQPTVLLKPDTIVEIPASELPFNTLEPNSLRETVDQEKRDAHLHLIKRGMDEIEKGSIEKVVLSRRIETGSDLLPIDLFKKLLVSYPNALCYLWYHPKVGLWLGATPEILILLKNRQLTTMSLAGTQKFTGKDYVEWGNKELEEQQLVTNYIVNALKGLVDKLEKTDTETVRAGNLLHLRTKITGVVSKDNVKDIVKALHPTPAVCGMPKANARDFITNYENYDREYYTGFLGELNLKTEKQRSARRKNQENQAYRAISSTTTLYVNLRCMQLKNDKAFLYVGGGITKDSNPEREWEETVAKSETMLSILDN
ncbi:hypothetical protein LCGC14_0915170 [marine sediment metagenome]|uniref:Chorismate-utilising enzyme C-terminal domain-containing protein n=1 Tax=marine sediment metagenome TaxID=412755 RepID=A0A0F9NX85_9ZZZZ